MSVLMLVRRWFRPRTCAAAEAAAEARQRSAAARREANARFEEQNRRYAHALGSPSLDWGPSLAACARAEAETGYTQEAHLPVAAGDTLESQVPAPDTVHAEDRARVRRSVLGYHDEDCSPDTPQPRQKDLP